MKTLDELLTERQKNDNEWKNFSKSIHDHIKNKLTGCFYVIEEFGVGVSKDRRCFQVYGAEESFKFDNNTKVIIKAENKKTGKFVKVYEYLIKEETVRKCSQAHLIHNYYTEDELKFLQDIRDAVVDYYRPNSIKFITDNF